MNKDIFILGAAGSLLNTIDDLESALSIDILPFPTLFVRECVEDLRILPPNADSWSLLATVRLDGDEGAGCWLKRKVFSLEETGDVERATKDVLCGRI
jgi:hypothetical protein